MATDRARRSFDASRMYRSVVSQQGRVTVEADANEAEEIRTAEARAELIDIVGPTGTPDDGFKISVPGSGGFDFAIGQGSLYVGGVRVQLTHQETYLHQSKVEWANRPIKDPDLPISRPPFTELVYLAVTEQEVSAVEDPALREVALGGPDTAGRTRFIQRVRRSRMTGTDCEAAFDRVLKEKSPGLVFDLKTMRLDSTARLKVDFVPLTGTVDPCQPTAQAGFLGAENQLVRVQVTSKSKLLWGYDNASFLYRAVVSPGLTGSTTLELQGTPVDVFHRPRAKQWVEVLATAVNLGSGVCIASAVGAACELEAYEPTANVITLKTTPELLELLADQPPQLFVRMWENRLDFVSDSTTATELITPEGQSTGVRVYTSGAAVPGDYWMIGVRPSMPQAIFPWRLVQFQPPDGPSRWATPLATIAWNVDLKTASVQDCRRPFDNLVELTEQCCEVNVLPGDDVQKILNDRIQRNAFRTIRNLHIRFAAGEFKLDKPLILDALNGGELTVSGCGAKLVAMQEMALVLSKWDSARVFDLCVEATVAKPGRGKKLRLDTDTVPQPPGDKFRHLGGVITFLNCKSSSVERVVAVCGSGDRRAACCVTIRNADGHPGDARVRSCEISVGTRQLGVLLVNVDRASVDDNQIKLHAQAIARIPADVVKRILIGSATSSDDILGGAWAAAFKALQIAPPSRDGTPTPQERRRIQRVISSVVAQIVKPNRTAPLPPTLLKTFRDYLDKALKRPELYIAAAGQGIVVGGVHARDIRIINNTITDAMDGIHIGLSARGAPATPLFADRVQVVGNTISVRVPWYERGAHAGILLGNVNVATVRDNKIDIQLPSPGVDNVDFALMRERRVVIRGLSQIGVTRRAEGIRVWGVPGPMLLVTGNSSQHADIGIHVEQVGASNVQPSLCLLTQNIAVDAIVPVKTSGNVTIASDNVP